MRSNKCGANLEQILIKNEYKEKGITLHVQRRVKKEISTLQGKLSFFRMIFRPFGDASKKKLLDTEGIKSVVPLDCYLGIDRLPFKMSAGMRWNPKTAQYIVTLVSKEASKKWKQEVVDFVLSTYR